MRQKPEVIKLRLELRQTNGESMFGELLRNALCDIREGRINSAGTHLCGIGYYQIIESQTEKDLATET